MNRRFACAMLSTICWFAMTAAAMAGPYDVTFKVPVNLTRLATTLTQVRVTCAVTSPAISTPTAGTATGSVDFPVSAGQVVTTATVLVPVTSIDTSNGRTSASYRCTITGKIPGVLTWESFWDGSAREEFRLSPTLNPITGTFTW